jgi:hypothetical protein
LALIYAIAAGAAGILSSRIAKSSSDDRLVVASPNCGIWLINTTPTETVLSTARKRQQDTREAAEYARACYSRKRKPFQCNTFPATVLPYSVNRNGSCPFAKGICRLGETAAYELDTGLLDSQEHFGINTLPETRVQFRKVTSCAPLETKPYMTVHNGTNLDLGPAGDTVLTYHYGDRAASGVAANYTFKYNLHATAGFFGYMIRSKIFSTPAHNSLNT